MGLENGKIKRVREEELEVTLERTHHNPLFPFLSDNGENAEKIEKMMTQALQCITILQCR
ncbi:uncharacterized protein G2W53_032911 [Senna tora]|uniref:Uncharacterized protein n=1 Tax=Senna tora TaxID=362788 RepID=A0A834SZT2_9FABA|nr:uncharacterized protein G2W53_032911 [Senna tora]